MREERDDLNDPIYKNGKSISKVGAFMSIMKRGNGRPALSLSGIVPEQNHGHVAGRFERRRTTNDSM
jgi:hypothetical protein